MRPPWALPAPQAEGLKPGFLLSSGWGKKKKKEKQKKGERARRAKQIPRAAKREGTRAEP